MLGDCNMYNVMIKITIKITNKTLVNQNLDHCFIRTNNSKILVMPMLILFAIINIRFS